MASNVVQFTPGARRRGERHSNRALLATDYGSWDDHYPAGIDGLWADLETGTVVPFPRP